jgi:molybdenum cofactor biosynthesis protein B
MLSRAVGGVARGKLVFSLPGSTAAVELAMSRLILPELGHLLGQLRR